MSAIWNSYSKSDTARMPRTMQSAPSRSTRSMRSPSKEVMRMLREPAGGLVDELEPLLDA